MPRILLAEDEAGLAQPVIERFSGMGHEVRWARAVREVRAELTDFPPDVMILDVTLDTDGLELFQAIRFAPEHPNAGVVILTPPGDIQTRERAQQLGAAAVLAKPVRGEELAEVVEDLLTFIAPPPG
jgi:DNA-binding response OmpR family regulator